MYSVNQQAAKIVKEKIIPLADQLNCEVIGLNNGATLVDMGVHAAGGWQAGRLFVEATCGGLVQASFGSFDLGETCIPSIDVYFDRPVEAILGSQISGWVVGDRDQATGAALIGSGPARALARSDQWIQSLEYHDAHNEAVLGIQVSNLPGAELAQEIADKCRVKPEDVYILAASTGSLTGSIQVCSRTVEASMGKLFAMGFDLKKIISGMGTSPVAPASMDEVIAMDRANSSLIYGGIVRYLVNCTDAEIEAMLPQLPFCISPLFGKSFKTIFEEGGRNFWIKDIHTVAAYEITNYASGNTFKAGKVRGDILKASFFPA